MTILLIDDDRTGTQVRAKLLSLLKYDVLIAYDGATGLDMAMHRDVDLVIVDAMMPGGMNGMEVLAHLQQVKPNLPTLILSGSMDPRDLRGQATVKPTAQMVKGTGAQKLLDIVQRLAPLPPDVIGPIAPTESLCPQ